MDRRAFVVLRSLTKIRDTPTKLAAKASAGFTLIELIITMGILALLAGLLFGPMDDLYVSNTRNLKSIVQVGDTRSALRAVQQQVELSNAFLPGNVVNDPLRSTPWASTGGEVLITSNYATTTDATGSKKILTAGVTCAAESNNIVYFVDNRTLYRRTLTNRNVVAPCGTGVDWDQRHTCTPGNTNAKCQGSDAKLADNVTQFSVEYYEFPYTSTPLGSPTNAKTVMLTLTTDAGDGPITSKMRITKANG
jgi:prepilin-type N-terminal cleavage/methylation domain-containing protein